MAGWKYEIVKDHSLKPNLAMAGKVWPPPPVSEYTAQKTAAHAIVCSDRGLEHTSSMRLHETALEISHATWSPQGPKKYAENFYWKGPKGREFPKLYEPPPPPPKN